MKISSWVHTARGIARGLRDDRGQGAPEYALLVGAVVVTVVLATVLFSDSLVQLWTSIGDYIDANKKTG